MIVFNLIAMVDQQKCGLYLIEFTNVFDGPYIIGINVLGQVISPITQGLKFEIPYVKANFFFQFSTSISSTC